MNENSIKELEDSLNRAGLKMPYRGIEDLVLITDNDKNFTNMTIMAVAILISAWLSAFLINGGIVSTELMQLMGVSIILSCITWFGVLLLTPLKSGIHNIDDIDLPEMTWVFCPACDDSKLIFDISTLESIFCQKCGELFMKIRSDNTSTDDLSLRYI